MEGAAATLTFGAALLLGLGFGAGPCNIACLPFLGPVFVASGGGVRRAWRVLLPFSLGRLTGYAGVGLAAGLAGGLATGWLDSPLVRWVLGGATVVVAVALLLRRRPHRCAAPAASGTQPLVRADAMHDRTLLPGGLFLMGAGMALNPCAPLSTVMLAAAATASAATGASLGLGFGLGAVLIPALVFGLGVAHLGSEINAHLERWRAHLTGVSAALLALMGIGTAMGWIAP